MLPSLRSRAKSYDFWITLHTTILSQRQAILQIATTSTSPETTGAEPDTQTQGGAVNPVPGMLKTLIGDCLSLASSTAMRVAPSPKHSYSYYDRQSADDPFRIRIDRTLFLVERCIRTSHLDICDDLLQRTLKIPGDLTAKFTKFYVPLIPRLSALLAKLNKSITMSPFAAFAQKVIGKYLAEILGKRGHIHPCGLRKVGCRCGDCNDLDKFILDTHQYTTILKVNKQRRNHLENQLRNATDLCTVTQISYGRPQGIKVTKTPAVVWACNWSHRLEESTTFLTSFGSAEVLSEIMGARLKDVIAALEGNQYILAPDNTEAQDSEAVSGAMQPAAGTSTLTSHEDARPKKIAKGQKRKTAPLKLLDVIDFTGEDSS